MYTAAFLLHNLSCFMMMMMIIILNNIISLLFNKQPLEGFGYRQKEPLTARSQPLKAVESRLKGSATAKSEKGSSYSDSFANSYCYSIGIVALLCYCVTVDWSIGYYSTHYSYYYSYYH